MKKKKKEAECRVMEISKRRRLVERNDGKIGDGG